MLFITLCKQCRAWYPHGGDTPLTFFVLHISFLSLKHWLRSRLHHDGSRHRGSGSFFDVSCELYLVLVLVLVLAVDDHLYLGMFWLGRLELVGQDVCPSTPQRSGCPEAPPIPVRSFLQQQARHTTSASSAVP